MKNILLFEPDQKMVPHLIFLLKLANIQCSVARTMEETINLLSAERLNVIHFDLLLLSSLEGSEQEKKILTEQISSIAVPVVYTRRENDYLTESLSREVVSCHPDNLLHCLEECLVSASQPSEGKLDK
ncbi:MAG: hypothetical protein U9R69_06515 [Thermodesulfobacteriota bacterium]|nr:hypothetical protein [Thermodesulfobacteriota bacterium]